MIWGHLPQVSLVFHSSIGARSREQILTRAVCLIAGVFDLGVGQTQGKIYLVMSPRVTPREMVETFTRVTGKQAIHSPTSFEEFGDLTAPYVGPAFKEAAMQMMQWAAVTPESKVAYGSLDPQDDHSAEELGLTASSFEEWLKRSGWTGPDCA